MTTHKYLARLNPLLEIEPQEAHDLADAVVEMEDCFAVKPHPKITATFNLLLVSAAIYGPRILLIRAMQENAQTAQTASTPPTPSSVTGSDATTKTH